MTLTFADDEPRRATPEEYALQVGFPEFRGLHGLHGGLQQAVLQDGSVELRARAMHMLARREEGGEVFYELRPYIGSQLFRHKRRDLDVDTAISSSYGYVSLALGELRQLGLHTAMEDFWLRIFDADHGVKRVQAVAGICMSAAILLIGRPTLIGRPSLYAQQRYITLPTTLTRLVYAQSASAGIPLAGALGVEG